MLLPLVAGKPAMVTPTMVAAQATVSAHGTWRWVPPQRLENGNIATDLDHFVMYRQAPGEMPAVFAKIHDLQKPQQWTMGTDQAGACFWFVAVRKPGSSTPMPSDKSNVICLDDQGQPLPRT
ncbi:MAG: hypothetical protein R3F24_11180 [Gammaproteobacteria bacterium]